MARDLDITLDEHDILSKLLNIILKISGSRKHNEDIDITLSTLRDQPEKLLEEDIQEKLIKFFQYNDFSETKQNTLLLKTKKVFSFSTEIERILKETIQNNDIMLDSTDNFMNECLIEDLSLENLEEHYKLIIGLTSNFQKSLTSSNKELEEKTQTIEQLQDEIRQLKNEFEKVKNEQDIDFLTEIYNRKAFERKLIAYEENFLQTNQNYAICFIDIDFFKNINDTYGHLGGDFILSSFTKVLKSLMRSNDIVARWGGEEFISLITYEDKSELNGFINRIQTIIKKYSFKYNQELINITFSGGISFREKNYNEKETILVADELLYKAKKNGRNNVLIQ